MSRFDWRQYESERREAGWPALITSSLVDRYREAVGDLPPWQKLVESLDGNRFEGRELEEDCLQIFDEFLDAIPDAITRARHTQPPRKCVFVSHQRADTVNGCRIACLAEHHQLDYWLDVHDPTLGFANQLPANDPRRSALIAAIIEIALLNSSHVIALHTVNSLSSRWVPYELGRAKARKITSLQSAGWFEKGQTVSTCGDYVQLAVMTRSEPEVAQWLHIVSGGVSYVVPANCNTHGTTTLK